MGTPNDHGRAWLEELDALEGADGDDAYGDDVSDEYYDPHAS